MDKATLLERLERIEELTQATPCTMDSDEHATDCPGCQAMRLLEALRLEIEAEEELRCLRH